MIDRRLHNLVDAFLSTTRRSAWLEGRFLRVYLRQSRRCLPLDSAPDQPNSAPQSGPESSPESSLESSEARLSRVVPLLTPCIDLANIGEMNPRYQLQGIFPAFLDHLESKPTTIYVENIGPVPLRWYFARRGYQRDEKSLDWCCYRRPNHDLTNHDLTG